MKVLGVLDLTLKLDSVDTALAHVKRDVLTTTAVEILLIAAFIILFTSRFISRPIHRLIEATRTLSAMQLDKPIRVQQRSEELTDLARSFDAMRVRLRDAVGEINEFTQRLEEKVQERTQQLKAAHHKLMHSDRLASLGQLSASVAHEINNPVSGVLNLSMLMQRIMTEDGVPKDRVPEFRRYLGLVVSETARVGRIVSDLLAFSRRSKPQRANADLNRLVQSTVALVGHKLKLSNVCIELHLAPELPQVFCDASQMQQVVLNLLLNSAQALQGRENGKLDVRTVAAQNGEFVVLEVQDNGEGIAEENLTRIFEPFFTTKADGKGVGLGLAVLYGIVQEHGGEVVVQSRRGEGSTFTVTLPVQSSGVAEPAAVGASVA
jgi:two-component system NtrC family sensor kinase